ncbi:MAG: asparagine synthase (glutamine-hydrolyzing) [Bacteroidota bacterium]
MCGIAGIISQLQNSLICENTIQLMGERLKYRGPDQDGYVLNNSEGLHFGLAHKRLSILDLSDAGNQPMWNQEKNIVTVFNGELYNFLEIRTELKNLGCDFISNSDTEVLIQAYSKWGIEKTLEKIEGMFAFCMIDLLKKKSFIARDRFGEKPLYYSQQNSYLAFSSDIRSFKTLGISQHLNMHALGYYFSELSTPIEQTIYSQIQKLPPATYALFEGGHLEIKSYWSPDYRLKKIVTDTRCIEKTEQLLEAAVKKCLQADVPVGCFLSGGLDSSLVALYAAKNYGEQLETFSVGFQFESFNELPFAKIVADKINSKHNEIILNPNDLRIVDDLLREYGEPFADSSAIPTYYLSKFASSKVKVALGGDGGDEIFAGYRTYNQGLRMQNRYNNQVLKQIIPFVNKFVKHEKLNYLSGIYTKSIPIIASALYRNMGFSGLELQKLIPDHQFYNAPVVEHERIVEQALEYSKDIFDTLLFASIKTRLPNDYLVKTDRASMFNSLELRTPFLDKNLIEYTQRLNYNIIMKSETNKYLTKKIAERYFSKEFVNRKKQGFEIPIGEWMRKEWKKTAAEVILSNNSQLPFNSRFIEELWNEHQSGRDHSHKLWSIYVFQKWSQQN